MDAFNNVANAAAKAVWGNDAESQQEPVSGVKGNTSAGEPYDAGNMQPEQVGATTPNTTNESSKNPDEGAVKAPAIGKPGLKDDKSAGHADKPVSTDSPAGGQHDANNPSDRPEEDPVPEAELNKPGPKPIEQVAKEHGGDAGNVSRVGKPGDSSTGADDPDAPQKESHSEGTGEKYVKSSGFAAEGGDFDAANPGAGREADRLVDEHIHSGGGDSAQPNSHDADKHSTPTSSPGAEKKSLKQKIKDRLHKH